MGSANTLKRAINFRRSVIGSGVAIMGFGLWLTFQVHSAIGACTISSGAGATAKTGIDSGCVKVLMSYGEGFVFMAGGLLVTVIAVTMISRRERLDLKGELRSVPRTWAKPNLEIVSDDGVVEPIRPVVRTVVRHRSTLSRSG